MHDTAVVSGLQRNNATIARCRKLFTTCEVCIYIYTYTYVYVYIYIYICIYLRVYVFSFKNYIMCLCGVRYITEH